MENILFQDVYKCFLLLSSNEIHSTIDNIQYFHDCSQSASLDRQRNKAKDESMNNVDDVPDTMEKDYIDESKPDIFDVIVTEIDIQKAFERPFSNCKLLYADVAIGIGKDCGALNEDKHVMDAAFYCL